MRLSNQINILHIARSFDVSGRSRLIHNICCGCKMDGMTSAIVSLTDNCGYQQNDVDLISLGIDSGFKLSAVFQLVKLIRCRKISVIHNHGRGSFIYAAMVKMFVPGVKLIHSIHRADGDIISNHYLVRKIFLNKADVVIAVSKAAAEKFAEKNNYSVNKVQIIYNGIDISRFSRKTKTDDSKYVIGTVANLSADKDIETLLRTFYLLNQRLGNNIDLRLRIIGDGPQFGYLKRIAEELGIVGQVEFMGFRNDVAEQLQNFDIFVLSTKTEGFGIAILEAMASGVPVVASRVGGIPEIIENGENGVLFEGGNKQELADAVLQVINDDRLRGLLIRNAGIKCQEFAQDKMIDKYKNIYLV